MSLALQLKSTLATTLTNTDGSHHRPASHHERSEGWTEVFGNLNRNLNDNLKNFNSVTQEEKSDFGYDWRQDDYYVFRTRNANVHPSITKPPSIRIDQYRPSFSIQLFLRLTCTPHLVFNSSNSCTESNGPLPVLKDLDNKASVGTSTSTVDVSTSNNLFNNGIFSYLLQKRNTEAYDNDNDNDNENDDITSTPLSFPQKVQRKSFMSEYRELTMILKCLRYGHDNTWDDLYRKQSIRAHLYPNGDPDEIIAIGFGIGAAEKFYEKRGWSFLTWFQIWAERIVAKRDIQSDSLGKTFFTDDSGSVSGGGLGGKQIDLKKAVSMAGDVYGSLDYKLSESTKGNLLDTENLSFVDVLLFGHLAEALCDIHLVPILIEYEHLISFFQSTYEKYFGKEYQVQVNNNYNYNNSGDSDETLSWIKWNDRMNALNQFNRIPMNDVGRKIRATIDSNSGGGGGGYQDAIKIMQSVALHCHDLREVLADAALLRRQEDELYGADTVPKSLVGKWLQKVRMGADLDTKGEKKENDNNNNKNDEADQDDITKKNEALMKKALREAKRNDELWISATICATIIGLLASANSSSG